MNFRAAHRYLLACAALILAGMNHSPATAALPIDIEVAMESGVPITAPQQWAKLLGKLDLNRVRLRKIRPDDQPSINANKTSAGNRVKVVAILTRRNELLLPKRNFKSHNLSAMRSFFQQLATEGAEINAERGRFDLTEKQFNDVHSDLSKVVTFSTATLNAAEMLNQLEDKFKLPVTTTATALKRLQGELIGLELQNMSTGTALAMALRQEGLALRPLKPKGGQLQLHVMLYDASIDTWPVGWKSPASKKKLAPKMFDSLNIEIANYTLEQALEAIVPRIGVPLILDQWILGQLQIDPSKIDVKLSRRKTFLKAALDRVLNQARLIGELRVDELGTPFYWVTQFGKNSLRAE